MVSRLQELLESPSNSAQLTVVNEPKRVSASTPGVFQDYDSSLVRPAASEESSSELAMRRADKKRFDRRRQQNSLVCVATNLGEPVGAIWMSEGTDTKELLDLYVVDGMRHTQVSQLLIRYVITLADLGGQLSVWIPSDLVPADKKSWFNRIGFAKDGRKLEYRLHRFPARRVRRAESHSGDQD
jgi:hypothetical protein